jgi:NTP pyrophosphatase (non-canonical NTP hydrolase)
MNIAEYPEDKAGVGTAITIPAIHGQEQVRLVHAHLGMVGELVELRLAMKEEDTVNIGEELADIMWFWAIAVDATRGKFQHPIEEKVNAYLELGPRREDLDRDLYYVILTKQMSHLADLVKKFAVYGRVMSPDAASSALCGIANCCLDLMWSYGLDPHRVLAQNIEKLRVRYPDAFNIRDYEQRDLFAERQALES